MRFVGVGDLMKTQKISVTTSVTTYDKWRNPIDEETTTEIEGVLVNVGRTSDLFIERPNGDLVAYTIALPKDVDISLRGAKVSIHGVAGSFNVIGNPQPQIANCPTRWNMVAELERADG